MKRTPTFRKKPTRVMRQALMARTSTWKGMERKVAEALGGQRLPVTGRHNQETPDVITDIWAIECKHGAAYSCEWLHNIASGSYLYDDASPSGRRYYITRLHALDREFAWNLTYRRAFPAWLKKAIQQAECAAKHHSRRPLVVIHKSRTPIGECICLMP